MEAYQILSIRSPYEFIYSPGHCWYYKFNTPLPVEQIEPARFTDYGYKIPKKATEINLFNALTQALKELESDITRYYECWFDYAPEWDEVTLETKNEGREMSLSLKHNHISYNKGLVEFLIKEIKTKFGEQSYQKFKIQWNKTTINHNTDDHLSLSELVEK